MNCENLQLLLTALLDGETSPETAAAAETHLATCPGCAQGRADLAAAKELAAAWVVEAPDITQRVMQAAQAEDQRLLLQELRLLRTEIAGLRTEVAALRNLPRRSEGSLWSQPGRSNDKKDYQRMENDPWILTRS